MFTRHCSTQRPADIMEDINRGHLKLVGLNLLTPLEAQELNENLHYAVGRRVSGAGHAPRSRLRLYRDPSSA